LVRAPELKNADILENVSRQRIEVNSASSERASDKRFEYIENLQQIIWTAFGAKLGQKPQNWRGKFFCSTQVGYVDKKFLNLFFVLLLVLLVPNIGAPGIYTCIIELKLPFFSESFGRKKTIWAKPSDQNFGLLGILFSTKPTQFPLLFFTFFDQVKSFLI
jgi:hypothetical protein